jgi:hypothetical protein
MGGRGSYRRRPRWMPGVLLLLGALALASCAGGTDPPAAAVDAHSELNSALGDYLAMPPPAEDDWDAFFDEGDRRVNRLASSFDRFAAATDVLVESGVDNPEFAPPLCRTTRPVGAVATGPGPREP